MQVRRRRWPSTAVRRCRSRGRNGATSSTCRSRRRRRPSISSARRISITWLCLPPIPVIFASRSSAIGSSIGVVTSPPTSTPKTSPLRPIPSRSRPWTASTSCRAFRSATSCISASRVDDRCGNCSPPVSTSWSWISIRRTGWTCMPRGWTRTPLRSVKHISTSNGSTTSTRSLPIATSSNYACVRSPDRSSSRTAPCISAAPCRSTEPPVP